MILLSVIGNFIGITLLNHCWVLDGNRQTGINMAFNKDVNTTAALSLCRLEIIFENEQHLYDI